MNTPNESRVQPVAAHLSSALRNLAVNSLEKDTQNHLHALATDAHELGNSHAALVEALKNVAQDLSDCGTIQPDTLAMIPTALAQADQLGMSS